ncbi:hypothetical protein [Pseudaminobacter salicylatoxidans]|uniref:hypothetical protein n=1 Tax=Pseudaminobacter salicylatoxidans TaxID=93369 RepID=UPI0012F6B32E|nr:hypothetical protein [Pseudaminobacter salicylatoxidans]
MALTADTVFRDFVTDGVPASGAWNPRKIDLREWGTWIETGVLGASGGSIVRGLLSGLQSSLDYPQDTMAWVIGDPVAANNGIYRKTGASGAGTWTRLGDLPYSFIKAANVGAGTADAIVATSSTPISASDAGALIAVNVAIDNTGPATISFNGGPLIHQIKCWQRYLRRRIESWHDHRWLYLWRDLPAPLRSGQRRGCRRRRAGCVGCSSRSASR